MENKMKNADKPIYPLQHEGFPSSGKAIENDKDALAGLTKREHFAAMAMQGLFSVENFIPNVDNTEYLVNLSVKAADMLLAELAKGKEVEGE